MRQYLDFLETPLFLSQYWNSLDNKTVKPGSINIFKGNLPGRGVNLVGNWGVWRFKGSSLGQHV